MTYPFTPRTDLHQPRGPRAPEECVFCNQPVSAADHFDVLEAAAEAGKTVEPKIGTELVFIGEHAHKACFVTRIGGGA